MALFRCSGGGAPSKNTLWTNASPATVFASQNVTLSDDIDNYDVIEFKLRSHIQEDVYSTIQLGVSEFKALNGTNVHRHFDKVLSPLVETSNNYQLYRAFYYSSDTAVHFDTTTGTASTPNEYCVPVEISGIKY